MSVPREMTRVMWLQAASLRGTGQRKTRTPKRSKGEAHMSVPGRANTRMKGIACASCQLPEHTTTTGRRHDGCSKSSPLGRVTDFIVKHPSQTRFTCPDVGCRFTYPTHHSLVRHMGVSHKHLTLITFQCALCEYTHVSLRSTSLHFWHAHGVAVPPL